MKPSATVETITPVRAREILDTCNGANFRNIRPKYVKNLSRVISEGEWDLNGEPIIFDRDGVLLDGQHRLAACVESGKDMETIVVRGIEPNAVRSIDTGQRRTTAQVLQAHGVQYCTFVAAAMRVYMNYQLGERGKDIYHGQASAQEYLDQLTPRRRTEMYDILKSIQPARMFCSLSILLGVTMIGLDYYDRVKVMEWAISVANMSAPIGSPAQLLSKRLHEEYAASSSGHANRWTQILLMARSMKAHCEGYPLGKLQFGKGKTSVLPDFGGKRSV